MTDAVSDAGARAKLMAILSAPENLPAATRHLGYELADLDPETGRVEAWFTARPEFRNPNGSVQGGIVTAFLDEAMSLSVFIRTHLKAAVPTLEMKTSFLRPLMSDRCRCVGETLRLGRSVGFTQGSLYNSDGVLCAAATATTAIRPFETAGDAANPQAHDVSGGPSPDRD
ncbi:MAG: PaaI family thioesterase [Oceanicaulis sp.]